jgi:hypothetical protein
MKNKKNLVRMSAEKKSRLRELTRYDRWGRLEATIADLYTAAHELGPLLDYVERLEKMVFTRKKHPIYDSE